MKKLGKLFYWELLNFNKISNVAKYLLSFSILNIINITLIAPMSDIPHFSNIFLILAVPISLIGFSNQIFKPDLTDGNLELLLTNFTASEITIVKFLSLILSSTVSYILTVIFTSILFEANLYTLFGLCLIITLITLYIAALIILIASIEAYFRSNTNFLPILIMTLAIPSITIAGLILQQDSINNLIYILIGIDLILVPISLIFAAYLIQNIYNYN